MEKKCSAWVLCPSKKFPGLYYYFNTQTGEKAWSWTVPLDQTPAGSTVEKPQPQSSFGRVEFPMYLHNHAKIQRKNYAPQSNINTPNVIGTGPSFTPRSRESEQQVSTTTHTNFKLAPAQFKAIPNNPFSLRLPLTTNGLQLCEGNASKKGVFEPIFTNIFVQKRRSSTDIEELNQAMKKAKISSSASCTSKQDTLEWNSDEVKYHVKCDDDSSSSTTQNPANLRRFRNENVKVCINFLRNLSLSENTNTWYLVPDVEVLLDNFNFLKKFIAGDRACSLLTPAAVLAKLQSLRDDSRAVASRASVAGQVIQWLTKNSVCQNDNLDYCYLDDFTIHKKIVQYCKEVNIFHVVIITKSKNLYDQAKRNDIHAYYLNALKIINQTENLFLIDPNNTNTFKWPTMTPVNPEICVSKTGERTLSSHSFNEREVSYVFEGHANKNKSLENDVRISARNDSTLNTTEGLFVEEKLREFCTKHAHLHANVIERIDECTCSFLQIMEHCLHNVMQRIPDTQFEPPCWLHQGLQLLMELYYQNKQLCAIVEHLISMCGFRINNGIMRPIIKSDKFIKILGAGILLIEQLEKILQFPELSDCKEMLSDLIASIQMAEDFPAVLSISLECRRILGDEPFRMEGVQSTENGHCNRFVSSIERTPQHEVINAVPDSTKPALNQNQSEIIDVQGCGGSIQLFRDDMLDNKSNAAFQPNHFNSNHENTVQSIDSNQCNTIQPMQCNQNKSNAVQQNNEEMQTNNNAVNCMTVSSGNQSYNSSSSVILERIDNGSPVFQKLESTVDMIKYALSRMKLFIEVRMEELKNGAIPERRKECLREKSIRLIDCAAGMFQTLKLIQKRENPNDPSFGKKFAVLNPAYTECIENCLEQVENMHRSFIYLLEALK